MVEIKKPTKPSTIGGALLCLELINAELQPGTVTEKFGRGWLRVQDRLVSALKSDFRLTNAELMKVDRHFRKKILGPESSRAFQALKSYLASRT